VVLLEAHDEWQVAERRYLSEGSMAKLPQTKDDAAKPKEVRRTTAEPSPPSDQHEHVTGVHDDALIPSLRGTSAVLFSLLMSIPSLWRAVLIGGVMEGE
jgi:hypothetical protein